MRKMIERSDFNTLLADIAPMDTSILKIALMIAAYVDATQMEILLLDATRMGQYE